jgi:hypothetical protein
LLPSFRLAAYTLSFGLPALPAVTAALLHTHPAHAKKHGGGTEQHSADQQQRTDRHAEGQCGGHYCRRAADPEPFAIRLRQSYFSFFLPFFCLMPSAA